MKAEEDYSVYLADPDLLVPWESIEQIVSLIFFFYLISIKKPRLLSSLEMYIFLVLITAWNIIWLDGNVDQDIYIEISSSCSQPNNSIIVIIKLLIIFFKFM